MKRQFINALLCGAVVLSTGTFTSCGDDDVDDLKNRITVVEGLIGEMKTQLENAITTGSTITSATETDGVWTLVLSDGKVITITPTSGEGGGGGGEGSSVTIVQNENSMTITVNGTAYEIPFAAVVNSLVYSPEYVDGVVKIADDQPVDVKFLAKPTPNTDDLRKATFEIAEAHELKTRAGALFRVKGEVTLEDGFIKVPLRALNVEAGKTYAVSVLMTLNGTTISSNYFNVVVDAGFSFDGEAIYTDLASKLIPEVTGYAALSNGFSTANLPESKADFLGEFNFKNLFTGLPDGVEFVLGERADQNDNVNGKYDLFKGCLSADGQWKMTGRPGTNGSGPADKPGVLVLVMENDVVKAKIYWQVNDPLANIDFVAGLKGLCSNHMERSTVFPKGVNKYDIAKEITAGNFDPKHGATDQFIAAFQAYNITAGSETVIINNGEKLEVTEYGKKLTKFSRGLNWFNIQTSVIASIGTEGGNGEIINGWDGISGEDMNALGLKITNDGFFETTAAYEGWGLRLGMGLEFEYDYGMKSISEGVLAYIFFNRRVSPDGVTNKAPR